MTFVASICATVAMSETAWAEESSPVVHVETEVGTRVFVERLDAQGRVDAVCKAPCDQPLDASSAYRVSSDSFRTTNHFRLISTEPNREIDVRIEPRTNRGLVSAVVLMSLSGAFATGGGFAIAWGVLGGGYVTGVAVGIAVPMIVVSLATGIPGVALLAKSIESRATAIEGDRIAASPRPPMPHAPVFSVPILTKSF